MTRLSRLSSNFDIKRLLAIEEASFDDPWTANMFKSELSVTNCEVLGAFDVATNADEAGGANVFDVSDGQMQGFISLAWVIDEGEIRNIAVLPELRRRGIASLLLNAAEERAREIGVTTLYLEVRESNVAAIRLYEERGYAAVGHRRGYYRNPREDAIIMGLTVVA
jgi:ribosomal-protein-alanine N-acetyltransferase